jgi:hypothetical protein
MLHKEWRHELAAEGDAPAQPTIAGHLERIRALIHHRLARGSHQEVAPAAWRGLLPSLTGGARSLWNAARMRDLLDRLNADVRAYVQDLRTLARDEGGLLEEILDVLMRLESGAGPHLTRWTAMNIVSERRFMTRPLPQGAGTLLTAEKSAAPPMLQTFFAREIAGALLPTVYLCGCLDELR